METFAVAAGYAPARHETGFVMLPSRPDTIRITPLA